MATWKSRPRPAMPAELETFSEWQWDDRREWIQARISWMRANMTSQEIARAMEDRRIARRRQTLDDWMQRLSQQDG